jgi:predicted nucleic acid-binding protein
MDTPLVVSDASPIIALVWLDRLDLFPALFGQVYISPVVYQEILDQPYTIDTRPLNELSWLKLQPVQNQLAATLLQDQLDPGESEAIVLSHELAAGLLLMDERRGRRQASQSGLTVMGTLGILLRARQLGLVTELRPLLDRLLRLPFHMSAELYQEILRRAGEV